MDSANFLGIKPSLAIVIKFLVVPILSKVLVIATTAAD
jgi:hypothetical protein